MDLVTMLKKCPEPLPEWLQKPAPRFDRASFFGSRTVYYPGFGNDGHPVSICARAHAAHAFVYVDYNVSKETVSKRVNRIGDPGFVGYEVEHEEEVSESDLRPGGWPQHVEKRDLPQDPYWFANVTPYGLLVVLKRREDRDGSHGPERLALLYGSSVATDMRRTTPSTARTTGRVRRSLWLFRTMALGGTSVRSAQAGFSSESHAAVTCSRSGYWSARGDDTNAFNLGRDTGMQGLSPSPGANTAIRVGSF